MKKLLSIFLAAVIFAGCIATAFAQQDNTFTGELNVISFNVDGLPVPSFLSSTKRNAVTATKLIAQQINFTDCDILCVQEDFNFHSILKNNLDMEYATETSGGAAIGDGLNFFSKYPIYNVGRVEWESAYGVYGCGMDELTPKGILYCTVEIADGVYIDVYNIHAHGIRSITFITVTAQVFRSSLPRRFTRASTVTESHGTDISPIMRRL